jgi:hypothetical protein
MSFRHIDIASALTRLAERRIEDAMKEGKFDHLPGAGKPLELEDPPADEDARLLWWALRLLRDNQFIPDEIRWRKQIALMKIELSNTDDEARLRSLVRQINDLVLKLNTLGTNAIRSAVTGVDEGEELRRLRERRRDHFHL